MAKKVAPTSRLEDATRALQQQELSILNRKNTIANYPNRIARLKSQVTQNQILLEFAELDLERTKILAPFDGRILSVDTATGNRVRNGDLVVKLYNTRSLEVRSQIPARYLPMMQTGNSGAALAASISHQGKNLRTSIRSTIGRSISESGWY